MKDGDFLLRIRILAFFILGFAAIVVSRLFFVQIINGNEFQERADRQYVRPSSRIFTRGSIFFSEKNGTIVSAASLRPIYIVAINPSRINNSKEVFDVLSKYYSINSEDFLARAEKENDPYEIIFKTEDKKIADEISAKNISGIIITKDNLRFYPGSRLAANVVGLVAKTEEGGDLLSGRYGIEKYFDDELSRNEESLYVNFFAEIFSDLRDRTIGKQKKKGDVILTIEPTAQDFLEKTLDSIEDKWNSKTSGGIIIEPSTGKIVAMAHRPTFDPGNFSGERNVSIFSNPLVENVFEMGSIFKPLTVAAGIDSGKISSDTKYKDDGFVMISGKKVSNFDGRGRGFVSMQKVLDDSLNTGAVFVTQQMGKNLFASYMKSFGFGEQSGIDLPNEVLGLVKNLDSEYEVDYATISFGQGIAVTPISMTRALSSLANGGLIIKPKIVEKIKFVNGTEKVFDTVVLSRVLKKDTTEEVSRMLASAYDNALLGGTLKLEKYTVAAKTGTAQMVSGGGGYDPDKFLHSFFGYFPAYNPRFLVFLYTVEPQNVGFSAQTLATPFSNIVKFLINYYQIPPDRG